LLTTVQLSHSGAECTDSRRSFSVPFLRVLGGSVWFGRLVPPPRW